ncbi:hypothetical protein ACFX1R_018283 [Malus domestica]
MVSSFSNPGFPPVDAHPTRLPAMDAHLPTAIDSFEASMRAALHDAIREALDYAFANFTTNFSRVGPCSAATRLSERREFLIQSRRLLMTRNQSISVIPDFK